MTEEIRFPMELGAAIRGSIVSAVKNGAFMRGLQCEIEEDRGWLSSNYRVRISGDGAGQYGRELQRWFAERLEPEERTP